MIAETVFWIVFVSATRAIAQNYERRRDVLYGSYIGAPINALNISEREGPQDVGKCLSSSGPMSRL